MSTFLSLVGPLLSRSSRAGGWHLRHWTGSALRFRVPVDVDERCHAGHDEEAGPADERPPPLPGAFRDHDAAEQEADPHGEENWVPSRRLVIDPAAHQLLRLWSV